MLKPLLAFTLFVGLVGAAQVQPAAAAALPTLALDPPASPSDDLKTAPHWNGFSLGNAFSVGMGNPYAASGSIASYFGAIHIHLGTDWSRLTPLAVNGVAVPDGSRAGSPAKGPGAPAANFKAAGYDRSGFNFTLTPSLFIGVVGGGTISRR